MNTYIYTWIDMQEMIPKARVFWSRSRCHCTYRSNRNKFQNFYIKWAQFSFTNKFWAHLIDSCKKAPRLGDIRASINYDKLEAKRCHILKLISTLYFRNGIMQSGSPTAPWALMSRDEMLDRSLGVAKRLSCYNGGTDRSRVAACLRRLSLKDILTATASLYSDFAGKNKNRLIIPHTK